MPLDILVVDDDLIDRMAVQRALRASGLDVALREASTQAEGLEALRAGPAALVFLDYLLPDGTGLDLLREIRAMGVQAPVVILTGQGDEAVAVELMKAGATDYLPKAVATPERIAQCVRNALRLHAAQRQAEQALRARERALALEQAAREEAEDAQQRLAFLVDASARIAESLDPVAIVERVVALAVPFVADWCWVDRQEPDGAFLRVAIAHADPEDKDLARSLKRRYEAVPEAPHGASMAMATRRSEVLSEVPDWVLVSAARDAEHLDALRRIGIRSAMVVPLVARSGTLGAITFLACAGRRPYDDADLAFAEELARRVAQGLENGRLYQQALAAEEGLRRQLEFTTAVANSLAEGVVALDASGVVTFANPAAVALLGSPVGAPVDRVLLPAEGASARDHVALRRALAEGRAARFDRATFGRPGGERLEISLAVSPILEKGAPRGAVLAFHDIAGRLRAEEELEASRLALAQSEKLSALGTLVSGVAHELRTPLTYLSNNIFLLHRRLELAAAQDESLRPLMDEIAHHSGAAMEGVERINALVKDLRPFAKGEMGRRHLDGLEGIVAGAVELYRATSRGQVEVVARFDPTGPVLVDKGQVQRVIVNLLVNAAEAMPAGGTVH